MKRIKTRALALLLSCCLCLMYVLNGYEDVQAADLSAGALQYGADLSFLEGLFMSAGAGALGLDMLLKTKNDINNWDWGDVLDSPASQGQIDKANETIEKLYNNAVKDWHEKHGGSSDPTPTPLPDVSPPVTVAPINPDDVELPEDWGTLKKNSQNKGILAMGAATAYCVKEAVKGWWDDLYTNEQVSSNEKNPFLYKDYVGYMKTTREYYDRDYGNVIDEDTYWFYDTDNVVPYLVDISTTWTGFPLSRFQIPDKNRYWQVFIHRFEKRIDSNSIRYDSYEVSKNNFTSTSSPSSVGTTTNLTQDYSFFVPIKNKDGDIIRDADTKPLGKSSMWPSTDLKDDYDNNRSPNLPELVTPALRLPTLDEIKNLWQQGSDDEDNRPIYVTNFITDHVVQTTPEPEPTDKPDANPTPTIAVVPDPGGGPGSGGSGSGTDPDNPQPENPEDEVKPYTADLKDVFPFCIPFDLIHLFEVFDAEPEAPVFEIPIDLQVDNPFTGASIVSYKDTIKIDLSDYEEPIKVIRVFEVIFFLIGLMLITRSHMIKG